MSIGKKLAGRRSRRKMMTALAGVALAAAAIPARAQEADWPWWHGPDRNGISTEKQWNPAALAAGVKELWRAEVGNGYSSVAIVGPHLYTMGNRDDQDIVYCLRMEDGKEVWRYAYACKEGSYPGPRATPAVEGGSVYTISRDGQVFCFDSIKGSVKWKVDITSQHGAKTTRWGFAGSPVIEGEKLLLNGGMYGIALAKATGEKIWSGGPGTGGYASPVVYERNGKKGVAIFGEKAVYGVDLSTGAELWSHPWVTSWDVNAADPIVVGDRVLISSGYGVGAALLDVSGVPPSVVWQNTAMRNHFSSSILLDGYLYGIDGNAGKGTLRCLEFATGKEAWNQDLGFGGLMIADGKLIVLNEKGGLFIAEASPKGYNEYSRGETGLKPKCWTAPVLCRGRIFCRNDDGTLISVDVRSAP